MNRSVALAVERLMKLMMAINRITRPMMLKSLMFLTSLITPISYSDFEYR
ncbi:MAG: hypothetical protein WDO14_25035 [Bacteroidota bacterium]